ncbi:MAG: site-specific DNA-methyltransferase [Gemmataceae bacterium]|nr:site-specific DNA-methyltransferase [Gemmataceae bacterium]MDW8265804.1 site-specific DNA-methyltransferase [Gemmataceae bacterium]
MPELPAAAYCTFWGRAYHGDARELLALLPANSVALVLTSPPFALHRQKAYGNVDPDQYVEWFWPFALEIHRVLRDDGSFVFDLGPAWKRGSGTRSLYQYELVLRLAKLFHVVQEFYWYNPSKLPTPAEYVTIRRTRVKDAVNTIWWLAKTDEPQADNRRVLQPYSPSMRRLLKHGYKVARRPSQHEISPHFRRDNGGAIPPNILILPNCRSNDAYFRRCRAAQLPIHPARFPPALPEFFIRFLTQPGQLVVDPFAGSNVTGYVAEMLQRQWISIELNADYVAGSRLRFVDGTARKSA